MSCPQTYTHELHTCSHTHLSLRSLTTIRPPGTDVTFANSSNEQKYNVVAHDMYDCLSPPGDPSNVWLITRWPVHQSNKCREPLCVPLAFDLRTTHPFIHQSNKSTSKENHNTNHHTDCMIIVDTRRRRPDI